jgi:hypothetical protein
MLFFILQRCGAGELNVFFERGPFRNGAQHRAVPKNQIAWRCAATTEGKQVGGKSQMLVFSFRLLALLEVKF